VPFVFARRVVVQCSLKLGQNRNRFFVVGDQGLAHSCRMCSTSNARSPKCPCKGHACNYPCGCRDQPLNTAFVALTDLLHQTVGSSISVNGAGHPGHQTPNPSCWVLSLGAPTTPEFARPHSNRGDNRYGPGGVAPAKRARRNLRERNAPQGSLPGPSISAVL